MIVLPLLLRHVSLSLSSQIPRIVALLQRAGVCGRAASSVFSAMPLPLKIGMFGGGTVGGGVYEIVEHKKKDHFRSEGVDIAISKICVRDLNKKRSFELASHTTMVADYDDILEDDSINCVVELMGGVTDARDVVFKALKKGKHVVTANKALLAQLLPEVKAALAENAGTTLGYEAAVCGGIPIIHNMQGSYVGDSIDSVMGIMNGTTNFMLTKMEEEGADYAAVLKEAQDLGFAEADPTADVEGHDVQAKIALLAKLAFGQDVPLDRVPCSGISKLTSADFACAKMMGRTIKLVGTAALSDSKDELTVFVSPVLVPLGGPLASARGAGNLVVVRSENLAESVYAGPGAGRYPTANSVVNDIVRLARLGPSGAPRPFPLEKSWKLQPDFKACFYARVAAVDGCGVLAAIGAIAAKAGVSINSVLRDHREGGEVADVVVKTDVCLRSQVAAFVEGVKDEEWSRDEPVVMSIL